jgi:ABC-type transporter Mla MlaB component
MTTWTLPAELTIFHVAELHRDWLARLAEHDAAAGAAAAGDEARIDAAALQQIDGAGLQLLLALRKALVERGLAVQLHDAGEPLRAAATALGLAVALGLGTAEGAAA